MKITVITLNFNGAATTLKLVESLRGQLSENFCMLVMDNHSHDVEELRRGVQSNPHITLMENSDNFGFAAGNKPGVEKAFNTGSDWVVLLNSDTVAGPDFAQELSKGLEEKEGLVGFPIAEEGKGTVYSGRLQWLQTPSRTSFHVYQSDANVDQRYISGAGMAISRSAYEKIGFMDENYFLYFEDIDYTYKAVQAGLPVSYLKHPIISHQLSATTKKELGPIVHRYHYRNALYFNLKNGSELTQVLVWPWSVWILIKQGIKILLGKKVKASKQIVLGVFDFYLNRMGKVPAANIKRIGIECESIEGTNPMWGIGRIIVKLLEEISARPELAEQYSFVLYFKDQIPDMPFLNAPIFEKKIVAPEEFRNRLWPIYYFLILPIRLWFEGLNLMFWPNYMLPMIAYGKSLVLLTEDVYYESHEGKLPFRYRIAYGLFGEWAAKFATRILAISETSKKNLVELYKINEHRIIVNHLGVDLRDGPGVVSKKPDDYILYVGQAFPRRRLAETFLAFKELVQQEEFKNLKFVAIGPDKYEVPTIDDLVVSINRELGREAITHKDYVSDIELTEYYNHAQALVYVSDREAFGLPPMEALTYGVPPVIADNPLGHELFGDYAFYARSGEVSDITATLRNALTSDEKRAKIKKEGPDFPSRYSWKQFTDRWIKAITSLT